MLSGLSDDMAAAVLETVPDGRVSISVGLSTTETQSAACCWPAAMRANRPGMPLRNLTYFCCGGKEEAMDWIREKVRERSIRLLKSTREILVGTTTTALLTVIRTHQSHQQSTLVALRPLIGCTGHGFIPKHPST